MASSYVAIEFRAIDPAAFADAVARIDAVNNTELIFKASHELPWYECQSMFGDDVGGRVVIWIHDLIDETERSRASVAAHPYRKIEILEREYEVPEALAALIDELDGSCSIVEKGSLSFTTRRYEAAVRDQLQADLEAAADRLARGDYGVEDGALVGRIEGAIPKIHELEHTLRRSGLVDADAVRVSYS